MSSTRKPPTLLLFNPYGTNYEIFSSLEDSITNSSKPMNVISFDYRGLENTWRAKDFVLDGESIYQYATKELGTAADKVHFFGYSLGGAIAAQVKALHPESKGRFVADRTFSSIFSLITEKLSISRLGSIIKIITSLIPRIFIAYPLYFLGWELDTKNALEIMKGKKLTIYHPNDCLVPFKANIASYNNEATKAYDSDITGPSTHFDTISDLSLTIDGERAEHFLIDFLEKEE